MTERMREEWGPVVLGFVGVFLGMGLLLIGMLPTWTVLIPLLLAVGVLVGLYLLARRVIRRWGYHAPPRS